MYGMEYEQRICIWVLIAGHDQVERDKKQKEKKENKQTKEAHLLVYIWNCQQ